MGTAMMGWKRVLGLIAVTAAVLSGSYAYWKFDLRFRPHTVKHHQAEIAALLEQSGYVSPGLQGPKLYFVSFRTCPECLRFQTEEFPKLQAAGVDTRVVIIARADDNGLARSTPAERSTVAELWLNRQWSLYEHWLASDPVTWPASGIVNADGDLARTSVIEVGRALVTKMTPLLRDNGLSSAQIGYPTLIWWTKDGAMRGCACEDRQSYRHVRAELGVQD